MRKPKAIRGAALLTVILVVGAAGMVGFLALAHSSINRVINAQSVVQASDIRLKALGCLEEVLINIQADSSYVVPGSIVTSTATCVASSSVPAPGQLDILVKYTANNLQFGWHARVDTATAEILELYPRLN
jgi:hypothetical protein